MSQESRPSDLKSFDAEVERLKKEGSVDNDVTGRPKPTSGQTADEFSVVLAKWGMTLADLVKTDYYWDVLKKDPNAEQLVEDLHASGLNPGPPAEPANEGMTVEAKVLEGTVIAAPDPYIAAQVGEGQQTQRLTVPFEPLHPIVRTSFPSGIRITISPEKQHVFYDMAPELKITPWSKHSQFPEAYLSLLRRIVTYYDGILAGVPSHVNRFNRRITETGSMGFNVFQEVERLLAGRYNALVERLDTLSNSDVEGSILYERVVLAALPREFELHSQLQKMQLSRRVDVYQVRDFLRHLNNIEVYLDVMPPNFRAEFDLLFMSPVSRTHERLMDLRTPYRQMSWNIVKDMVIKTITISTQPTGTTFLSLLNTLKIATNRFDSKTVIPAQITVGRTVEFYQNFLTCVLMSRWFQMSYYVDKSVFDSVTLLECIVLKLLTPKRIWSDATVADIDNYIALHLIMHLKNYRADVGRNDVVTNNANRLEDCLVGMDGLKPFLVTTRTGGGWSAGGVGPDHQLKRPAGAGPFYPNELMHESVYGRVAHDETQYYPQLLHFTDFVEQLVSGTASKDGTKSSLITSKISVDKFQPTLGLLDHLRTSATAINTMSYNIDEQLRQLSFIPIVAEKSDADEELLLSWLDFGADDTLATPNAGRTATQLNQSRVIMRSDLIVKAGDALSLPIAVDVANMRSFQSVIPRVFEGWSFFKSLDDFTGNYRIAVDYLKAPFYKKSDRVRWAIDNMTTFLKGQLTMALEDTKMLIVPAGGSQFRVDQIKLAEMYLAGSERLHGFTRSVVYNGKLTNRFDGLFKLHTVVEDPDDARRITAEELLEIYERDGLTELTMNIDHPLVFTIPVPLTARLSTSLSGEGLPLITGSDGIGIRSVEQSYLWADDSLRAVRATNEFAFVRPPAFSSPDVPFDLIVDTTMLSWVQLAAVRKEVSFFSETSSGFKFILRN
jgi:hypothetical protein